MYDEAGQVSQKSENKQTVRGCISELTHGDHMSASAPMSRRTSSVRGTKVPHGIALLACNLWLHPKKELQMAPNKQTPQQIMQLTGRRGVVRPYEVSLTVSEGAGLSQMPQKHQSNQTGVSFLHRFALAILQWPRICSKTPPGRCPKPTSEHGNVRAFDLAKKRVRVKDIRY